MNDRHPDSILAHYGRNMRTATALCITANAALLAPIPQGFDALIAPIGALLGYIYFLAANFPTPSQFERPHLAFNSLTWLIIAPTAAGLIFNDNTISAFARDYIPLLFLATPLLLYPAIQAEASAWATTLRYSLLIAGTTLSLRYLITGDGEAFADVYIFDSAPLNQCPTVIFAAVFGISGGFIERSNIKKLFLLASGLTCFLTLLMGIMRAQIAITIIGAIISTILSARSIKPRSFAVIVISATLITIYFWQDVTSIASWAAEMISGKNSLSGGLANGRDAEAQTVLDHVSSSIPVLIFGEGWGSEMFLPSAMDVVRFTHQGLFYFLWKTGIIGVVAIILYAGSVLGPTKQTDHTSDDLMVKCSITATICALIIFTGIEMGYKMLSYSFVLCLLMADLKTIKTGASDK